jgi:hypothetical protein
MPTKDEISKFSEIIENLVYERDLEYMDAVITYCNETGFEIELAATLLASPIKAKIGEEAQSMNLMKKINRLPI